MTSSVNPNEGTPPAVLPPPAQQPISEPSESQVLEFLEKANASRAKMQAQTAKDKAKICKTREEVGGDDIMKELISEHAKFVVEEERGRKEGEQ